MPLGTDYARQDCSLARSLEVVGERWTLLILRDAFFGVRRFSEFQGHLDISRAVLSTRLEALVADGLLTRTGEGHPEYELTEEALGLWPALFALGQWGERRTTPGRPRRLYRHVGCGEMAATAAARAAASSRNLQAWRCARGRVPTRRCATIRSRWRCVGRTASWTRCRCR